jgi:chaperonin GroEL
MASKITYGFDARKQLVAGATKLSAAVAVTMGPRGRLAVLDDGVSMPHLTKDGVTVANAVKLKDPLENSGAMILREASRKTASSAGDGTTTTCVLATGIMTAGLVALKEHENHAREFFDGLNDAIDCVLEILEQRRQVVTNVSQIQQVATISANGDKQLGELLANIIEKLGPRATILIEEARTFETTVDFVDGTEIDRGFVSPQFSNTNSSSKCKFEKPIVAIFSKKINSLKEILWLLENVSTSSKPLLIFAEDYEPDVLKGLLLNKQRGALAVCACKLPEFGGALYESAQDLVTLFGGEPVQDVDGVYLGSCELAEIVRDKTTVLRPAMNLLKVNERIDAIDDELTTCTNKDRASQLTRRRQRLTSGLAVLRVGATTEVELKEKLDRVDDAVNATRVAALYGILPGGGDALLRASLKLQKIANSLTGAKKSAYITIAKAIEQPFRVISQNACYNSDVVLQKFLKLNKDENVEVGYDVISGEFVDLVSHGIVDPYEVTRSSLQNALSVAKKILEVGCVINSDYNNFEESNV